MHYFEIMGLGLLHIAIVLVVSLRVIMQRRAPGVSLAWLLLVILLPYAGAVFYILIGERTLGRRRVLRAAALLSPLQDWLGRIPSAPEMAADAVPFAWPKLRQFVEGSVGFSAVAGNRLQLIEGAHATLKMIIDDIVTTLTDDFAKYKKRAPVLRLQEVFTSIVHQAGGKFKFSNIPSSGNHRAYKDALDLLIRAGLAYSVLIYQR